MEQPFADIFDWMFKLDCISSVDRKILNEGIIDKIKNLFRMNSNDKEEEDIVSYPLSYGTPDGFSCPALRLKGGYKNTNAYPFFYYGESKMGWIGTNGKCHTDSIADMPKRKDADAWLEKLAAKKGVKSKVCMWKKMRSRWADAELVDGRIWMFETPVMLVWNVKNAQWMIDAAERLARGIGFNKSDLLIGYGKRLYPYESFVKKTNGQVDDKNSPDSEYVEDLEQMKQAHLLNGEEKSKIYKTYLTNRYKNMSTQLTNDKGEEMSRAEYNALRRPYSESKNHR